MFDNLPKYIFYLILDNLCDEADLQSIAKTSKTLNSQMNKYGTKRELILCRYSDKQKFIRDYINKKLSTRVLYVSGMTDPCIWIPEAWPHTTCFINCDFGHPYFHKKISPPVESNTEELIISCKPMTSDREYVNYRMKNPLSINTKLLPNLKRLKVTTVNFDYSCLEGLRHLEVLDIKTTVYTLKSGVKVQRQTEILENLPSLKEIYTNSFKRRRI